MKFIHQKLEKTKLKFGIISSFTALAKPGSTQGRAFYKIKRAII
jgi:hypothetical protein